MKNGNNFDCPEGAGGGVGVSFAENLGSLLPGFPANYIFWRAVKLETYMMFIAHTCIKYVNNKLYF